MTKIMLDSVRESLEKLAEERIVFKTEQSCLDYYKYYYEELTDEEILAEIRRVNEQTIIIKIPSLEETWKKIRNQRV